MFENQRHGLRMREPFRRVAVIGQISVDFRMALDTLERASRLKEARYPRRTILPIDLVDARRPGL